MNTLPEAILTIEEVAHFLRIPRSTIYSLAQGSRIPAFKVGRQWRVKRTKLEAWMERQANGSHATRRRQKPRPS